MYKVIGNDGKTYGPVALEPLRDWIVQGRVDNRTPVLLTGAADWTFLGLLPELAPLFSGPPPVIAPPKKTASGTTNSFATAGFVCGLLSWICCCGCPFNVLGLFFSIIALVQINTQSEKQAGWGLALAGLICSAASLLFCLGLALFHLALAPADFTWHAGSI